VSICVSVTRRYCIKTAKRRVTQATPHDSPETLDAAFDDLNIIVKGEGLLKVTGSYVHWK